ncbi:MAG: response regulator [Deltaproteobacteria bacterium]|jgi:signal transduction histidine kinase/CheY-like chemotaxis protein/HPt (histidine-containing phosphotransfer) domain-containing protein|nr:response regulator [Deltaproteobacteria bacterium]
MTANQDPPESPEKALFNYLRDVIYNPSKASFNPDTLAGDAKNLGLGIMFLAECVAETRAFANALARGDLSAKMPSAGNEIAAPLKTLYSSLKHLTWQSQQIAAGDYSQRVDFMGAFADSFNSMIRQLNQRNRELVMSKETAEAASRAKSAFLATVSHEMRTPLNAILGLSAVELQRDLPTLTRMNLEKIWNAGSSLLRIVNDVLDISRAEAGTFVIIPVDYDIIDLINDVVQINIVRVGSKPINFELFIDETIPRRLCGDSLRVKQILNNILSNAFKYTERGKVRFDVSWRKTPENALVVFTITDTGVGIKPNDIGKIFTENSQINSEANRYVEGTGLGLSITKYLVDLMGGTIGVESEFGVGSVFTALLPQKVINDAPIGFEAAQDLITFKTMVRGLSLEGNLARTQMPYGHVLLVDDVPTNLDVAEGLLSPYGLRISTASSGREAVDLVAAVHDDSPPEEKFDLILMDHMMPGMDGVEATRKIRAIGTEFSQKVPIVAFTANALSGMDKTFLEKGFNAFILKPIDVMQLDAALNRYVRRGPTEFGGEPSAEEPAAEGISAPEAEESGDGNLFAKNKIFIDGLDIETGVNRYGKDEKFLKVLKSYVLHIPKLLETLKATARSSLKDYAISVHGLKGSSYGISANVVGDLAAKLETMAKEGKNADANEDFAGTHLLLTRKTEKLIADLHSAIVKIENSLAAAKPKKKKLTRPNPEILGKVLEYAKRGKTSLIEDSLSELEGFAYEEEDSLIRELREHLDNFDYHLICEKLEKKLRK